MRKATALAIVMGGVLPLSISMPVYAEEGVDSFPLSSYEQVDVESLPIISDLIDTGQIDKDAFLSGYTEATISSIGYRNINSISVFSASTNGCSYSPDRWGRANFKPSCDRHDICYSRSSSVNRLDCDNRFLSSLISACASAYAKEKNKLSVCIGVAGGYYKAVRWFGSWHYQGKGKNN